MSAAALARDLAAALDPGATARAFGMVPEPWQDRVLRTVERQVAMLCARQVGKSTTSAVKVTQRAVYVPGSMVILVSPSQRQSDELLAKIKAVYRGLGRPVGAPSTENAGELRLENGSRILSLPATEATTRGFSAVDLLVFDEAAKVPDDIYAAFLPMLTLEGQVLALSTPGPRLGWFYEAWEAGPDGGWDRHKITAYQSAQYPPGRVERMKNAMSDRAFRAEYLCEFVGLADMVFDPDDIDAMYCRPLPPLFGGS